jgi:hypothetical protein
MIRRKERDDYFLITQDDHAALAGRMAEHIGNARFSKPEPYDQVIMAIALHDAGWPAHDDQPTVNPHLAPLHVFETPMSIAIDVWSKSVAAAEDEDPYTALLVSLHVLSLSALAKTHSGLPHERYESPEDLFELNKFQHAQVEYQASLRAKLGFRTDIPLHLGLAHRNVDHNEDLLNFNFGLLKMMDRLSLDLLCNEDLFMQIENIYPRPGIEPINVTVRHSVQRYLVVDPWPFNQPELSFEVPFKRVPVRNYGSNEELQQLYAAAPSESMEVRLVSP